ncbi:MAG: hypothetical protein KA527_08175 [Cytophagaceae bacterium]|nr:hypothetical protein [Cytophagaceae bacterium]MBP6093881.1 hypothetical protein [Cytophagaceae bacterium]
MENLIKDNVGQPAYLENLYRSNPTAFADAFHQVYPEIQTELTAQIWHERLRNTPNEITWGASKDWIFVAISALIVAFLMQMPDLFSISHDFYFPRNMAFIAMPGIAAFFAFKQDLSLKSILPPLGILLFSVVFINLLPVGPMSDTLLLSCIHLPILIWLLVGYIYSGAQFSLTEKRIDFLRFHGDLLVMSVVILLAGGLFTALTINLFGLIGIKIEDFYFRYLVLSALPTVPLLATLLVQQNPTLVSKISPVIARIFTPLVSLMLIIFLLTFIYSGKDPYNDREFLLIFNGILIGVMALLLFSVSESTKDAASHFQRLSLIILAFLAIINNGIALSAIAFRLFELGITPNRFAVLGSNVLVLVNLVFVTRELLGLWKGVKGLKDVEASMTRFLPFYALWAAIVSFVFPLIFSFQ